jgi:hypothetical protein
MEFFPFFPHGGYLKNARHIFVELTNAALSLLQRIKKPEEAVKVVAEDFRYDPKNLLQIIGFNQS